MPFTLKQIQRVQDLEKIVAEITKVDRDRIKELDKNIKVLTANLDTLNLELVRAQQAHHQNERGIKSLEEMGRIQNMLEKLGAASGEDVEKQKKDLVRELREQEREFKRELETEAGKLYTQSKENLKKAKLNYEKDKPKRAEMQKKIHRLKEELKTLRQMPSLNNSLDSVVKRCTEALSKQFKPELKPSNGDTDPKTVLESAVKYSLIRLTGSKDASEKKVAKDQCIAAGWKMGFGPSKTITTPPSLYKKSGLNMAEIDEMVFSEYTKKLTEQIKDQSKAALGKNETKPEKEKMAEPRKETTGSIRKKPLRFTPQFSEIGHSSNLVSTVSPTPALGANVTEKPQSPSTGESHPSSTDEPRPPLARR